MRRITKTAIQFTVFIGVGILPLAFAMAQSASPSLEDQLSAEYQVANVTSASNGGAASEPGPALVVQKDGVFGVPPGSMTVCRSMYQGGKMSSTGTLCPPAMKSGARPFRVGEKVYASQIHVNLKNDEISFGIVACDSCNGTSPPTAFKSEVIFKFARGSLQTAGVPEVEDKISEVFAFSNNSVNLAAPPGPTEPEEPGPEILTNETIIRMAAARLGDAVILEKIKTSQCDFDTSTGALIKLGQAGVSQAVMQAMMANGAPAPAPTPTAPETASTSAATPTPTASVPPCANFDSCLRAGRDALQASQWATALTDFRQASSLDPSNPKPVAEQGQVYTGAGQYDDAGKVWDNALALGGTLVFQVWHFAGFHVPQAVFRLSSNTVTFIGPKGETVFSVPASQISDLKSHHPPLGGSAWSFGMKVQGHRYWFSFVPLGIQCKNPIMCSDPAGYAQEKAVAAYIEQTVKRLASGNPAKTP
jgi:hypothetical protein